MTILHENKTGGDARGHLGTELVNKAETVLKIVKDEINTYYSVISSEIVRGLDFDDIYFSVDDNIPVIIEKPLDQVVKDNNDTPF